VQAACDLLKANGLREQVMIDVSHANSSKQHARQITVAADVAAQIAAGDKRITGIMIESHLQEGRQDIVEGQPLKHGVSVTDACISFAQTVPVLNELAAAVKARRRCAGAKCRCWRWRRRTSGWRGFTLSVMAMAALRGCTPIWRWGTWA
jgi:3-deoxy-7-phosphoheptulonate synthase